MVETGEDWIDLPDETPEAAASSLASGGVDPLAPFARDDEFLVAMLEESTQVKREHPAFAARN